MNSLTLKDLSYIVYDFYLIKLQSPKIFEHIIKYFNKQNFDEDDLIKMGDRISVNLIHHIAYLNGQLNDERFFKVVKAYINKQAKTMNKFKLAKMLDLFKYFQHFDDRDIKVLLEKQMQISSRGRVSRDESEEEDSNQ